MYMFWCPKHKLIVDSGDGCSWVNCGGHVEINSPQKFAEMIKQLFEEGQGAGLLEGFVFTFYKGDMAHGHFFGTNSDLRDAVKLLKKQIAETPDALVN